MHERAAHARSMPATTPPLAKTSQGLGATCRLQGAGISSGRSGLSLAGGPLLMMTQPPDARYARLGSAGASGRRVYPSVRALLVHLDAAAGGALHTNDCVVRAEWRCRASGHAGAVVLLPVSGGGARRRGAGGGGGGQEQQPTVYEGQLPHKPCGAASKDNRLLWLQVRVHACGWGVRTCACVRAYACVR